MIDLQFDAETRYGRPRREAAYMKRAQEDVAAAAAATAVREQARGPR